MTIKVKKILAASLISFSLFLLFWYKGYFFTFNGIKVEFYEEPVVSPNGTHIAETYYEYYGGAAGGVNAVVEVNNKVVYYADAQNALYVEWKNDETLYIPNKTSQYPDEDRSMTLNVADEIYHDDGKACRSWLLKGTFKNCYSKH